MKEHVIIIGWKPTIGKAILDELKKMNVKDVVVISSYKSNELVIREIDIKNYIEKSDPEEDLEKVKVKKASSIIILGDEKWARSLGINDIDLWIFRIIGTLNRLLKESEKKPWIVSEIYDRKNEQIAIDLGADEVIGVNTFGYELLAQSASKYGLSNIYKDLLTTESQDHEIYFDKIDPSFFNGSKKILYAKLLTKMKQNGLLTRRVPLGILRNQKTDIKGSKSIKHILTPEDDFEIIPYDKLIVLATNKRSD